MDRKERAAMTRQENLLELIRWAAGERLVGHTKEARTMLLAGIVEILKAHAQGLPADEDEEVSVRHWARVCITAPVLDMDGAAAWLGIARDTVRKYSTRMDNPILPSFTITGVGFRLYEVPKLKLFEEHYRQRWIDSPWRNEEET